VMPNSVARLVFRVVAVVLGKVRAADLLQMVVFGEIGSDQEDGCEGKPSKQNEPDCTDTTQFKRAIDMTDDELAAIASRATLHVVK
jgi:hypothetical protein